MSNKNPRSAYFSPTNWLYGSASGLNGKRYSQQPIRDYEVNEDGTITAYGGTYNVSTDAQGRKYFDVLIPEYDKKTGRNYLNRGFDHIDSSGRVIGRGETYNRYYVGNLTPVQKEIEITEEKPLNTLTSPLRINKSQISKAWGNRPLNSRGSTPAEEILWSAYTPQQGDEKVFAWSPNGLDRNKALHNSRDWMVNWYLNRKLANQNPEIYQPKIDQLGSSPILVGAKTFKQNGYSGSTSLYNLFPVGGDDIKYLQKEGIYDNLFKYPPIISYDLIPEQELNVTQFGDSNNITQAVNVYRNSQEAKNFIKQAKISGSGTYVYQPYRSLLDDAITQEQPSQIVRYLTKATSNDLELNKIQEILQIPKNTANSKYGLLMRFRYLNKLNPKQEVSIENINRWRQNGKFKGSGLDQYSDDQLYRLFNEVAYNDFGNSQYANYAKSGGKINYLNYIK